MSPAKSPSAIVSPVLAGNLNAGALTPTAGSADALRAPAAPDLIAPTDFAMTGFSFTSVRADVVNAKGTGPRALD